MPTTAQWRAIQRVADQLEPAMRRSFLDAIRTLRQRVNADVIEAAMQTARVPAVEAALAATLDRLPGDLRGAVDIIDEAFARGGRAAARSLRPQLGLSLSFDATNPFAIRAAERYGAKLIRYVNAETRAAVRQIISQAIRQGLAPRDSAKLIENVVGLSRPQARAVARYRAQLLADGLSKDTIGKKVDTYSRKKLRERAATIARTETIDAANGGQLEMWKQTRRDGLLGPGTMKVWIVTPDDRLCIWCRALDGQIVPLNQPFVSARFGDKQRPTLHPRCRCAIGLVAA